jgi:chemotaxis protein CheZ
MADPMAGTEAESLTRCLAQIRSRYPAAEPEWVADVVRAVIAATRGQMNAQERSVLQEVEALGRVIANAKAEIAALRVDDITVSDIPFATDELDAIVAHTASATEAILESCEALDVAAGRLGAGEAAHLQEATTRIYEACSFQDITGQRITKVVATLKAIEQKVAQIVQTFGGTQQAWNHPEPEQATAGEASLLNGPQLPAAAMDQADIDQLLASFD